MRSYALVLAILGGCGGNDPAPLPPVCEQPIAGTSITFRLVAKTQGAALLVTSPPNDVRHFVVEQEGRIKLLTDAGLAATPFLDISSVVSCCGEQGLLGLAFHPSYASNRTFFVYYTTGNANVIARYQASATDPSVADPASGVTVLSIPDFASNHNGGMIEFGRDGLLYIGTGDGGGGGDPQRTGQNPFALLGKMLRIDVDEKASGKEYGIPAANPFANGMTGAPEVYIMGLRNPWRWSFDRMTGDLWIGDVGQGEIEELTMIPAGTTGLINLGWNMYEGTRCFAPPCDGAGKTPPQIEKTHGENWCSVIAGEVYRGACYPDIVGKHYFTDYCDNELLAATRTGTSIAVEMPTVNTIDDSGMRAGPPRTASSLHGDARGELYLTTTACCGGTINGGVYRLEAGP